MRDVVIIDNDAPTQRVLAWALGEDGYAVRLVSTVEAPLAIETQPPECVIFTTNTPFAEKRALIVRLRAASAIIVVDVAVDGVAPPPDSGADIYLPMPLRLDALEKALASLERDAAT